MYSGTALLMDVHHPVAANGRGVIFVPGSAWSADTAYEAVGIKDGAIPRIWVPPVTTAGYTVFVPNHREMVQWFDEHLKTTRPRH